MKKNLLFIVLIVLLLAACTQFSRVKKASILAEESKVSISLPKFSTLELPWELMSGSREVNGIGSVVMWNKILNVV